MALTSKQKQTLAAYKKDAQRRGVKPSKGDFQRFLQGAKGRGGKRQPVNRDKLDKFARKMTGKAFGDLGKAARTKVMYAYAETTGKPMSREAARAMAGVDKAASTLFNRWISKGELSEEDYKAAGVEGIAAFGQGYAKDVGGIAGSALGSGVTSMARDWSQGRDIDYKGAAFDTAKGFGGESLKYMTANAPGGSTPGGAGAGAGAAGIFNIAATVGKHKLMGEDSRAANRAMLKDVKIQFFSTVGSMIGSVAGAGPLGGMVGSALGEYMHKVGKGRDHDLNIARFANPKSTGLRYNPKTGKMEVDKVLAVDHFIYGGDSGNKFIERKSDQEFISKYQKNFDNLADQWNWAIENYDTLDLATKMQVDAMKSGKWDPAKSQHQNIYGERAKFGEKTSDNWWMHQGKLTMPGFAQVALENGQVVSGIDLEAGKNWKDVLHQDYQESYDPESTGVEEKALSDKKKLARYQDYADDLRDRRLQGQPLTKSEEEFLDNWESGTALAAMGEGGGREGRAGFTGTRAINSALEKAGAPTHKSQYGIEEYKKYQASQVGDAKEPQAGLFSVHSTEPEPTPSPAAPKAPQSALGLGTQQEPTITEEAQRNQENVQKFQDWQEWQHDMEGSTT